MMNLNTYIGQRLIDTGDADLNQNEEYKAIVEEICVVTEKLRDQVTQEQFKLFFELDELYGKELVSAMNITYLRGLKDGAALLQLLTE